MINETKRNCRNLQMALANFLSTDPDPDAGPKP